jgi:hypothetical protein
VEREWEGLRDSYLPIRPKGSLWWYSRKKARNDLPQGWKLHVSATILSACGIFRLIAPYLRRRKVLFKAPKSLVELEKLNAGIYYGFSQVGKFITVYPPSTEAAVALAHDLDRLTANQPAPLIPYDEALRFGSCVHYRYGQLYSDLTVKVRSKPVPAIVRPDGKRVPDRREPHAAVPPWLADPFRRRGRPRAQGAITPLESTYGRYEALVQRGRGGVYRALDRSSVPAKPCIIKEGRRHGETDWLGRDGVYRIQREARFLRSVSPVARGVPRVITTFCANRCFYLVMERITGRPLQAVIASRERISTRRTLAYCLNMARIIADIHSAGWVWGDCKPANFLCGKNHELRAHDFEGAYRLDNPDPRTMETPAYLPPKRDAANPQADDLFSLGVSFVQLVTRKAFPPKLPFSFKPRTLWAKLPEPFVVLTENLLDPDPAARPAARTAQRILERLLPARSHSRATIRGSGRTASSGCRQGFRPLRV